MVNNKTTDSMQEYCSDSSYVCLKYEHLTKYTNYWRNTFWSSHRNPTFSLYTFLLHQLMSVSVFCRMKRYMSKSQGIANIILSFFNQFYILIKTCNAHRSYTLCQTSTTQGNSQKKMRINSTNYLDWTKSMARVVFIKRTSIEHRAVSRSLWM